MAIVNKIRERSGIAVAVIAVALLLFILGGDFLSGKSKLFGSSQNSVGDINGTEIDFQEYAKLVEAQKAQFEAGSGRSASEQDIAQIRDQVWEKLVFQNVYVKEYEKLGISVGEDELRELIQGNKHMHPYVRQQFSDKAGNFNAAQHADFIKAYSNGTMPEAQRAMWDNFKRELIQIRLREKYSNLLNKGTYLTQAEVQANYLAQNEKASGKFLYVPFSAIQDATIKVDDSEIKDYYSKHKEEFIPYDSRTISYVTLKAAPTKQDSAALLTEITQLAKGLASAAEPQKFASANTDIRSPYIVAANQLSENVKSTLANSVVGAIVGPFKEGSTYSIYKYEGTAADSLSSMRASHILFRADSTMSDSAKTQARIQASAVLAQLKAGANFSEMAQKYGTDGSAQNGGDLGVFQNNHQMVPKFENALFGYSGKGLMPNLVETQFGFHIVNVTEAKSNLKYKLATISKELTVGEAEANLLFQKVDGLRSKSKTVKELEDAVKKDHSLALMSAPNVAPNAKQLNNIDNAREIIQWAYNNDNKVGDVADRVFIIGDNYIVAGLKAASNKANPDAMDFKEIILTKIRNEKKGEQIITKLGNTSGDLAAVSSKYGQGAVVEDAKDITLAQGVLGSAGLDGIAVGRLFGQKMGTRSKPFVGETGVFVMETALKTAAPVLVDAKGFKAQLFQQMSLDRVGGYIGEQIIRENAKIVDNRAKLF